MRHSVSEIRQREDMDIKEVQTLPMPDSASIRSSRQPRPGFFRSLAWVFVLIAIAIRIWLTIDTRGIIEGDEALLGLQAEQILRGAHPIYFWAQPYMGTLEAHLVALLFWIAGPSTWTLRAEPILLSILLMWLTWKLANALADLARLPGYARRWFVTFATCVAALPPLYDLVVELRTYGGYIETFILTLWLLLSALRLTQRWHQASTREMALRWMGIGFLVGLGLWVYPLIIMAILTTALWIVGYIIIELAKIARYGNTPGNLFKGLFLALTAIPTAMLGFAPGIYWGLQNNWENIRYLISNGGASSGLNLHTIAQVITFYGSCSVPRVVGGALPTGSDVTAAHPQLLTPELLFGGCCLLITLAAFGLSFLWRQKQLVQAQRLAGLPLLFAGCSAVIFCTSRFSAVSGCGPRDLVGRYTTPLLLVLPFLFAAALTLIVLYIIESKRQQPVGNEQVKSGSTSMQSHLPGALSVGLLALILIYAGIEGYSYARTSPNYTMQTSGCKVAPANDAPIIAYMQQEHIRYAWASGWVGNPITFATGGSILVIDPRWAASPAASRIPAYIMAILRADRPNILLLANHDDPHPDLLKRFDQEHITYRFARFPSEPGVDLLLITPLNHSVSPFDGNDLGVGFGGC